MSRDWQLSPTDLMWYMKISRVENHANDSPSILPTECSNSRYSIIAQWEELKMEPRTIDCTVVSLKDGAIPQKLTKKKPQTINSSALGDTLAGIYCSTKAPDRRQTNHWNRTLNHKGPDQLHIRSILTVQHVLPGQNPYVMSDDKLELASVIATVWWLLEYEWNSTDWDPVALCDIWWAYTTLWNRYNIHCCWHFIAFQSHSGKCTHVIKIASQQVTEKTTLYSTIWEDIL